MACLPTGPPVPLGNAAVDGVLGGGLRPGALHEVFARGWSAGGFAVLLALLAAGTKPLFWVRPDYEAMEYGALSPGGLLELGGDPRQLVMVRTRGSADALSAAGDILACPHVGALLLELEGAPKCLDLVASRRLVLAAEESGVTAMMLRAGAMPEPSAALTRWQVASAPSSPLDDDWGNPVFDAQLVRHRAGRAGPLFAHMESRTWLFRQRRILALWLPRLPTDRLIRKHGARFDAPLVISQKANNALHRACPGSAGAKAGLSQGPASGQCPRHGAAACHRAGR